MECEKRKEIKMETIYDVPVLLRREIEALMVKPFLDAFEKELGHEKTYEIVEKVIAEIAFEQGKEYAELLGGNGIDALMGQAEAWSSNDALDMQMYVENETDCYSPVKRCAYVNMYERIGMKELGKVLSCLRDEFFYQGFNPEMEMCRSKTLMDGGDCCDFCFKFPKEQD